jgi:hypothetical protein
MFICENSNCAAVETGESLKMRRRSKPQPSITFLPTQTFQNQLRNPGSFVGGWYELSQQYPDQRRMREKTYRFASMGLGRGYFPVSYGHCISVHVDAEGLAVSVLLPFRIFHPPFFIPWSAIAECKQERFWFLIHKAVYVIKPKTRLSFHGRVAAAIDDYWQRYRMSRE